MIAVSALRLPLLRRLALLLLVEGLGLLALGVGSALQDRSREAVLAALLAALTGLLLIGLARAADRGRGWSRSPAVVVNLFALPIGLSVVDAGEWPVGVGVLSLAVAVLYLFATPELRLAFREG